jgi:ribosome-associated toxin RatA of RatAB toxin-antitoxin module
VCAVAKAIERAESVRRVGRGAALALTALALGAAAEPEALAPGLKDAACVACRAPLEDARLGLSLPDWEAVISGEIVTGDAPGATGATGVGRTLSAAGVVAASPVQIWSVLTDWPAYPRFMPNIAETRVRQLDARRAWLSQHLKVFWADVRYGTIWELEPEVGRLHFALDPAASNDLAATEGRWCLTPLPQEGGTLVRYEARIDTGMAVPEFVQTALTRRSLPALIRAIRDEVQRRASASH